MLVRIYEKLRQETDFIHGFYAISSYSQLDLVRQMDAVSAGWSRMTWDGATALLSTTSANSNEYAVPSGYEEVADTVTSAGGTLNLSVYMDTSDGVKDLLASAEGRSGGGADRKRADYHLQDSGPQSLRWRDHRL